MPLGGVYGVLGNAPPGVGEALKHRPGKARPLLGDDDDLVAAELADEPLRWDRLAIDGDLRVGGQRREIFASGSSWTSDTPRASGA
jgi:hypothetical protein